MKYLSFLLLIPFGLGAQQNDRHYLQLFNTQLGIQYKWYNRDPNMQYGGKNVSMSGIDSLKRYYVGRSGKARLVNTQTYNAAGQLTGDILQKVQHTYQYTDTLLTEVTSVFPNGKTYGSTYAYDSEGRLTESKHFSKGKMDESYRYAYSGKICTLREYTDLRHRKPQVYRIVNEIGDNGKIARSTYTINGKVKKVWDYSCNEKGTPADDKTLAQSSSCTFEQHNSDGSYSVFTRSLREGRTYLVEAGYSGDSVLTYWKEFLNDSILVRRNTLSKTAQRFDFYTDKGKYKSGYALVLDEDGRRIETHTFSRRGRERNATFIVYNEKGLITSIGLHERGKKTGEERFEYTFGTF